MGDNLCVYSSSQYYPDYWTFPNQVFISRDESVELSVEEKGRELQQKILLVSSDVGAISNIVLSELKHQKRQCMAAKYW